MSDARFGNYPVPPGGAVQALRPGHPALENARTLYPTTVTEPELAPRILIGGENHRKLGKQVIKGPWAGFPIYALTLEERATCPRSCHHWATCYGNGMHWARRLVHGAQLEQRLEAELAEHDRRHPHGFAVRLHVLGDFYSVEYVRRWSAWLARFKALHVFGYTAWPESTPIGREVLGMAEANWSRFAIRLSATEPGPARAVTVRHADDIGPGTACPTQTGGAANCGSCALCWSPEARGDTIYFLEHGPVRGRPAKGRSPYRVPRTAVPVTSIDRVPSFIASIRAEIERLKAELQMDPRVKQLEALLKVDELYAGESLSHPAIVRTKRGAPPRSAVLVGEAATLARARIVAGATAADLVAEFSITPAQARGMRVGVLSAGRKRCRKI